MKTSKNFHNLPNDDASSQRLISNHKELFSQNKTSTSQKTSPKGVSASKCEMGISLNLNLKQGVIVILYLHTLRLKEEILQN